MPDRQTLTAHDLNRLTESITELSDQVEVLRDVLDEIRSDLQWAVQNERLVALPIVCVKHVAVKRMVAVTSSFQVEYCRSVPIRRHSPRRRTSR